MLRLGDLPCLWRFEFTPLVVPIWIDKILAVRQPPGTAQDTRDINTHCVLMPPVRPRGYVVVAKMQGQAGSEAPDNKSKERTNALLSGEDPAQIHPRIIQPIDQMRWPFHIEQQYFGYSWSSKISSHLSGRLPCDNPESAPDLL